MCLPNDFRTKAPFGIFLIGLLLSSLLQVLARHYPDYHPDLMDGLRGLFLGIAIGSMALAAWRRGHPAGQW